MQTTRLGDIDIKQIIPEAINYPGDRNSAGGGIVRRETQLINPVNGPTFNPTGATSIEFQLSSDTAFLDGKNTSFNFKHQTGGTASGTYNYLQDGGLSWVKEIDVYFGGQLVEQISYYNLWYNAMVYTTSSQQWYSGIQGIHAGYYLLADWNNKPKAGSLAGVKVPVPSTAVSAAPAGAVAAALTAGQNIGTTGAASGDPVISLSNALAISVPAAGLAGIPVILGTNVATQATNPTDGSSTMLSNRYQIDPSVMNRGPNGFHYSVPLSLLGIVRSKRAIPLKQIKQLKIVIQLDTWANSHVSDCTSSADCTYTITECQLQYDLITPLPAIVRSLDELTMGGGAGLQMVFDTFLSVGSQTIPAGTGAYTQPISVAKSKLKTLYWVFRTAAQVSLHAERTDTSQGGGTYFTSTGRSLSTFNFNNLKQYQLQLGDRQFPSVALGANLASAATMLNNCAGMFNMELQKAQCQWDDHVTGGILGYSSSAPVAVSDYVGNYTVFGCQLETITGNLIAGLDTKSMGGVQLQINMLFDTGGPYGGIQEIDVLAHYDVAVAVRDGAVAVMS
jgi:hypothetical protein